MASFKLHMEDRFAAASANPRAAWRHLARPARSHYDRLILLGAAGLLIGAAAVAGLQFMW